MIPTSLSCFFRVKLKNCATQPWISGGIVEFLGRHQHELELGLALRLVGHRRRLEKVGIDVAVAESLRQK